MKAKAIYQANHKDRKIKLIEAKSKTNKDIGIKNKDRDNKK